MLARKTLLPAGIIRQVIHPQHQLRTLTVSAPRLQGQPQQETSAALNEALNASNDATEDSGKKAPYRTARYLLEQTQRQAGRRTRRDNNNSNDTMGSSPSSSGERRFNNRSTNDRGSRPPRNNRDRDANYSPASKFQSPPTIPYDTSKELQFADKVDWEVSSILDSRPLYANIAGGRGTTATLGVSTVQDRTNVVATAIPGTAFSAHITGVRSYGDFDPEVEQSLIQTLAPIAGDSSKDHRKKSDVAAVEHQAFLNRMTHNFQEIMNPRNPINKFNNAGIKHVAAIKYEIGSDDASTLEGAEEKSWRRLERLGGDYSRASAPLSLLSKGKKAGKVGEEVLKNVSDLIGQNQSIGLEDKKKFLKAVEKGLGGI
ncbi:hypothetical protein BGZ97_001698 [Linnemannia gamsii]|jgi:hypothetical protein|uniref:Uncharacterized protein n=1 Tax=Linnemannia gamsii TaxID=64522 RepID=A0A9P6QYG4_9FUNG|nr:hypothetical protein BGZ97_001698 [Linnemannia gamsii]